MRASQVHTQVHVPIQPTPYHAGPLGPTAALRGPTGHLGQSSLAPAPCPATRSQALGQRQDAHRKRADAARGRAPVHASAGQGGQGLRGVRLIHRGEVSKGERSLGAKGAKGAEAWGRRLNCIRLDCMLVFQPSYPRHHALAHLIHVVRLLPSTSRNHMI